MSLISEKKDDKLKEKKYKHDKHDKHDKDITNINQQDYQPKRFNLKFNPPIIVIEYTTPSTGKTYNHNIRIKKLHPNSDLEEVIRQIYEKHFMYLDSQKVKISQVISTYKY